MASWRMHVLSLVVLALLCLASLAPSALPLPKHVSVWFNAGLGQALIAMQLNIRDFEAEEGYAVDLTIVPEGNYADAIGVAGKTGDLPCLLLLDGPTVAHFAWLGYLQPLDRFIPKTLRDDLLPSILEQGTYQHRLYAIGVYDSGLALFGNRRHLQAAGVRLASTAHGVLDGPASVAAMSRFQRWFQKGWANARPVGDDLVLLPLPDFGRGPRTGLGAWTFAIASSCQPPEGAWALLRYSLRRDKMLRWTDLHPVPRPVTPAYATITAAFAQAVDDIIKGEDVRGTLTRAADRIDQDIAAHVGYR